MSVLGLGPIMSLKGLAARLTGRRKTYFIAHAYEDKETRQFLLDSLPAWIEPLVFDPITVTPDEHVSDHLIAAIRDADGLIYLESPISMAAFWPAFERRFATRIGKTVLAFLPSERRLASRFVATDLPVAPLWNPALARDAAMARRTLDRLQSARGVEALHYERGEESRHLGETAQSLRSKTGYGAPVVLFVSAAACARRWPFEDDDTFGPESEAGEDGREPVVAWTEPPQLGAIDAAFAGLGDIPGNRRFRAAVRRSAQEKQPIVLARGGALNRNEADNLLVRLEYRAHQQRARSLPTPADIAFHEEARHERQRLTRM
jgi:hypothetical protein